MAGSSGRAVIASRAKPSRSYNAEIASSPQVPRNDRTVRHCERSEAIKPLACLLHSSFILHYSLSEAFSTFVGYGLPAVVILR